MRESRTIAWIRRALLHIAVFAAYVAAGQLGFLSESVTNEPSAAGLGKFGAPVLWLPPGIALAACILGGWRMSPTIIVAALVNFVEAGCFGASAIPMAIGAGLAPALVAAGLGFSGRFDARLRRPADLGRLLAIAIPCGAGIEQAISIASIAGMQNWGLDWLSVWSIWSTASAVCSIVMVPSILLFAASRPTSPSPPAALAFAGLVLGLAASTTIGLLYPARLGIFGPAGSFLPVPFVLLLAVRFDRVGAATASLLVGIAALGGAAANIGPFAPGSGQGPLQVALTLWSLVLGMASTALLVGITVAEQRHRSEEFVVVAERLRRVVDAARLGSWLFDGKWRTIDADARLAAMLGTTTDGLRGRCILEFLPESSREHAARSLASAVAGGGGEVELECRRVDGRTAWLGLHVSRSVGDEGIGGAIAAVEDLAERRRAEAEWLRLESNLLHSQKLESLGVLAGGVAHDFNNIVMGIRGNAGLLRVRQAGPDAAHETADRIDALCQRAAELVSTLLAYAGKSSFSPERLDLCRALREAVSVARLAAPTDARIELDAPSTPVLIEADPHHLRQLLVAIIANATESLPGAGGRVQVRVAERRDPQDTAIEVLVQDDGCGMDAATLGRVFEPFFSTKGMGRGLGMSAALGIARRLGGDISIASEPRSGTQVRVSLPLAGQRGAGNRPQPVQRATGDRQPTALLSEPDPGLRRLLRAALEVRGYTVCDHASLQSALDAALARAGSLVVGTSTGSSMPAIEAIRTLRDRGCWCPIVLTSDDRDRVVLNPKDPRTVWLTRPFELRELIAAVDRATAPA